MAKWQDYTAQIDSILGGLTPEQRQAVERYTTSNELIPGGWAEGKAALEAAGYSSKQAEELIHVARNVRKAGGTELKGGPPPEEWVKNFQRPSSGEPGGPEGAEDEAKKRTITSQIQAFIDSMTGDMAPNDPIRMQLVQAGTDAAQKAAGRQGISGRSTAVGTQAASVAQQNLVPYQAQRASMAAQGLNLLNQRDLGLAQLESGALALQNQKAEAQWAAQQNQNQALGSALGTVAGTVAGAYFGMPELGKAGGSLGGGIGGMVGGGQGPQYQTAGYSSSLSGKNKGVNPYTGS